jgi:hypothetical protein
MFKKMTVTIHKQRGLIPMREVPLGEPKKCRGWALIRQSPKEHLIKIHPKSMGQTTI